MAECTRWPQKELERREKYLRTYHRERNLWDPFTWDYPWKCAALSFGICIVSAHYNNLYTQKPWYFAFYPRAAGIAVACTLAYWLGKMREYHCRTRDAVVDHYMATHPSDFERVQDIYGRPYSNVLLPWYPKRTEQKRID